jgi:N-acyl-D-aspartate/D-glutamate deacylase
MVTQMPHDLIIRNGTLIDGTGTPPRKADLAIGGGRISAIGAGNKIACNAARRH